MSFKKYKQMSNIDEKILNNYIISLKNSLINIKIKKFYKLESIENLMWNILVDDRFEFDLDEFQLFRIIEKLYVKNIESFIKINEDGFSQDLINKFVNYNEKVTVIIKENFMIQDSTNFKYELSIKNNYVIINFDFKLYEKITQIILNSGKKISLVVDSRDNFEMILDQNIFLKILLENSYKIIMRDTHYKNFNNLQIKLFENMINNNINISYLEIQRIFIGANNFTDIILNKKRLEYPKIICCGEASNNIYDNIYDIILIKNLKILYLKLYSNNTQTQKNVNSCVDK